MTRSRPPTAARCWRARISPPVDVAPARAPRSAPTTRRQTRARGRYGNLHTSRFVRPLAACATLISIEEFVLVAQNVGGGAAAASVVGFRRWPRRTAGRGLGSLSRFGDGVESVCCGGPQPAGSGRCDPALDLDGDSITNRCQY